ncbi:hypothetical protein G6F65_020097 [Rhizopus arrhizus]|nr:hypothetical protein G6F65_020097 [Rhizopus arrhizus]
MLLQIRLAGQAASLPPGRLAGGGPVMGQRGFKTDAEAARRQGVQCGRHGDFLLVPGGGQAFRADFAAVAFQRGDRGHVIRRQPHPVAAPRPARLAQAWRHGARRSG